MLEVRDWVQRPPGRIVVRLGPGWELQEMILGDPDGPAASKPCPGVPGPSPGRELSVCPGRVGLHRKRNSLLLPGSGPEAPEFILRVSGHGPEALGPDRGCRAHRGYKFADPTPTKFQQENLGNASPSPPTPL